MSDAQFLDQFSDQREVALVVVGTIPSKVTKVLAQQDIGILKMLSDILVQASSIGVVPWIGA
jgi:hypothetical protein